MPQAIHSKQIFSKIPRLTRISTERLTWDKIQLLKPGESSHDWFPNNKADNGGQLDKWVVKRLNNSNTEFDTITIIIIESVIYIIDQIKPQPDMYNLRRVQP